MAYNKYQTQLTDEVLAPLPDEVKEQLFEFINTVPFIRNCISSDKKRAMDLERDDKGRIIVDVTKPHILENMDYFRPSALFYKKNGCYTLLRPNPNPNSEYGRWIRQERDRCWNGMVRESDGEWVTGYMYFYLNYCPIIQSKIRKGSKIADRIVDFPEMWEGVYYAFHYIDQMRNGGIYNNFKGGQHGAELARRGASKSYMLGSMAAHNFIFGENKESSKEHKTIVTASQKEYLIKDGTLNKFLSIIDFCASNTQFPRKRLKESIQEMTWTMGYKDAETNIAKGTQNTVIGVTADEESKLRGKRGHIYVDEFGSFPKLSKMYNVWLPSVQEGDIVFGMIFLVGTAGDKESDFQGASELMYNPNGYNLYPLPNVYDKESQGKKKFVYFFPAYLNRKGCYDKDGNSDVIKALIEILMNRYRVKHNSSDPFTIVKTIAEQPITPSEAIIKTGVNIFPVTDLGNRLAQLDNEPNLLNEIYVGSLIQNGDKIEFKPDGSTAIRDYPINKTDGDTTSIEGAIEIITMPEIDKQTGKPFSNRYIAGLDPYENDQSDDSTSLGSMFVLDLFTDKIVAEYTGRPLYAEDFYENVRKICLFYNAVLNYEAHPYDQTVRLPDGTTKQWGEIKIGDVLFAPNGTTTKVVDIPIDGVDDIYKLTFEDGRIVEASKNHIWAVHAYNHINEIQEVTTEQMFLHGTINRFGQRQYFIPESGLVEYKHQDIPIDPYTLGLLISEGSLTKFKENKYENFMRRTVQISASKEDAEFYSKTIPYKIKHLGTKGCSYSIYIDDIDLKLKELGLINHYSHEKFIPEIYLYNDLEVRMELLKGLMDGDGCATKYASVFVTTSRQLADDIMLLCRSLGIKVFEHKGTSAKKVMMKGKIVNCKESYRIAIASERKIFKNPRKADEQHTYNPNAKGSKAKGFLYKTAIKSIEYVGKKQCKCVTVDRQDGLYLIGDYITTHNCNKKGVFAYFSKMNCLYLLTDTLEYLRDKMLVKSRTFGNTSKGTTATLPVNNYAKTLLRNWLLMPVTLESTDAEGKSTEITMPNLYTIRNRALIRELMLFNPNGNFDRISSMGMLMLLREDRMVTYGGDIRHTEDVSNDYVGNDDFFTRNYDKRFKINKTN